MEEISVKCSPSHARELWYWKKSIDWEWKKICEALDLGEGHGRIKRLDMMRRRKVVTGISRLATTVWTALSVRKSFTSAADSRFRKYVTDGLGYVSECYVGQVVDDGDI